MSVGVRERGRVSGRVAWFLTRYWVALGVFLAPLLFLWAVWLS